MADIKNVKLGNTQINKIYCGENISWIYEEPDITAPVTTPYPTPTVEYAAGREVYFEVNETCFTYYTLDGSPVSVNSILYDAPIVLNEDTTINYFSIDLAGNAETPKTVFYNITEIFVEPSINWINPQNVSVSANGVITKISGGDAWNAGADSTEQSDGTTDFIIEYIPQSTDVRIAFGLDEVVDGIEAYRNKDIDFNWEINPDGLNEITVNEVKKYEGTYAAGDIFRVALENGNILFYQNGEIKFENLDPINFPIKADVSMYLEGLSFNADLIVPLTGAINPTNTIQTTFPFTVTLTGGAGKTIYYRLGTGTQQTYTAPFSVSQASAGVAGVMIPVHYWVEGEAEQSITYDTTTAIAGKPVVVPTAGNNQVVLNWAAPANTTSYNVYRSTVSGELGTALQMYGWQTTYTDLTAVNGTTYYYTVKAANYGNNQNSDQVAATPEGAAEPANYRYVRVQGYGDNTSTTTRIVELEAMEGATNRLLNKLPMAGYPAPNGGTIGVATNGAIVHAAGYPLWWSGAGIPILTYDLGAAYPIDFIRYVGYSKTTDPRQTKFKLWVSTNNVDYLLVTDQSLNTTPQPEAGFAYAVEFA